MKLLIKPSNLRRVKKAKQSIKDKFQRLRGSPIGVIIREMNLLIRGTGNYWSNVVAKKIRSCKAPYLPGKADGYHEYRPLAEMQL